MTIDWTHFTPMTALTGGIMIGLAAVILILVNGRIAGISGILGGLLTPSKGENTWRVAFLLGMVSAPLIWVVVAALPAIEIDTSTPLLVIAGLLVGFGTRMGSGCTSGHGVCGLSRLSPRSLVATALFMAMGFVTVYIVRHVLGGV
ncbi:YeeE/YedE family protein [Marinobacter sp. R17]|uniref:YeeE/YedE family protein n=1 Tax=Marinobacter sp. R17 TaxID=2484250 RepID=UPI0016803B9C|nr:YeeE/YedE family protein [Marinobacter sp. R17]